MNASQRDQHVLMICRGSARDGLGHVMRTRTVAQELARTGGVSVVVIGDRVVDALMAPSGLDWQLVDDDRAALDAFEAHVRSSAPPSAVVFDTMRFDEAAFDAIKSVCPVASLSPIFDRLGQCDALFHRTRHLPPEVSGSTYTGDLHAGLEYAVIRRGIAPIEEDHYNRTVLHDPLAVAVSMGGGDAQNKTLQVLEALRRVRKRLLLWVLLGEGYSHSYQALVDCVRRSAQHEIILAKTSDSMWRVLHNCSLAVLAGGTVTYEAAHARLPSINLFESADHTFLVRELVDHGVCLSAGHPFDAAVECAVEHIERLDIERSRLAAMHRAARGLIDDQGASRIARLIRTTLARHTTRAHAAARAA